MLFLPIKFKSVLFAAIRSLLVRVPLLQKKIVVIIFLFPAEIQLTLKHRNLILKSEKYAKPQNKTPTDFSIQIEMMIFIYFHKAYNRIPAPFQSIAKLITF